MNLHNQKGTSMVEMAIVLLLFLMIIFAIMEFSIAVVRSAQLAEATRGGVRYAIVNDPLTDLTACIDAGTTISVDCDAGSCSGLIERMALISPLINVQDIEVTVKYSCPDSEYLDHNQLYLVTVSVSGAQHHLTVPGVFGLNATVNLQTFQSTRLSEDLHTAEASGK